METKKTCSLKTNEVRLNQLLNMQSINTVPYKRFGTLPSVSEEERFAKEKGTMLMPSINIALS